MNKILTQAVDERIEIGGSAAGRANGGRFGSDTYDWVGTDPGNPALLNCKNC